MKNMQESAFNRELIRFIQASPTPFHAVARMESMLKAAGFVRLLEADAWNPDPGSRYYVTRNDSSIIAFGIGKNDPARTGFRMVGAHTDSPCLKVKPRPELLNQTFFQVGVEVYGGVLLNTWFDRDLSMAGRVTFLDRSGAIRSRLIDFARPVAVIPNLAIHFDREANKNKSINPQEELPPILMQVADGGETPDFREILLDRLKEEHPDCEAERVFDFEISLYDTQAPTFVGMNREFISGSRLDNLISCYTGLQAMAAAEDNASRLLVCNDHEEVGSASAAGAQGPFLRSVLERLCPSAEDRQRLLHHSLMISADDAHGFHPNYANKYDSNHRPVLNRGPVIKVSAAQRYASNSETMAEFRQWSEKAGVPVQEFVMRNDMPGGSTIGPLTASRIGVRTVDAGVPIFAMHSIRETAGIKDAHCLFRVFREFFIG
jgi:aspartyl aminopeptidase